MSISVSLKPKFLQQLDGLNLKSPPNFASSVRVQVTISFHFAVAAQSKSMPFSWSRVRMRITVFEFCPQV
nr:MAG TPA: hypothetical protein [Caudoviricetes sp.]